MHQIIVLAIPVFALLIAGEFISGWAVGRNTYRVNDAISSLSQGLLSQVTAVCTPLLQIGLYTLLSPHLAVIKAPAFWEAWYGWIAAVILYDFCDYWLHRVSHECALFWAAHVVHHQSQCFNFSTALRQESAYALLGWVFYLPLAVLGIPPELYGIAGLIVLIYQFWIHTEHVGKLGWFDRVFSSPSNHRVHHAINDRYLDKNYGAIFVLWDRLFGTFEPESEKCVYGTRAPLNSWDPLYAVGGVYLGLIRQAWRTPGWGDKLRVFLKGPGWQPQAAHLPQAAAFDPYAVAAYDPPITATHAFAAGLLFCLALATSCLFLWQAEAMPIWADWLAAGGIAACLWCTGALMSRQLKPPLATFLGMVASGVTMLAIRGL